MLIRKSIITTSMLTGLTLLAGMMLASAQVSADNSDALDKVSIEVPISCTMKSSGMNSHNKEIPNGTYQADIGTTTLKAFCNDANGFAIYAAGYTGDEIGAENSNKLVNAALPTSNTIETGTATAPGNPDVSNWAMKLTVTTGTYAATLDNGFGNYSAVPNEYTKVAHRDSNTDYGESAEGATLTATYAAYMSKTQPAGTYSGKVIYTLIHPSTDPAPLKKNQIGVNYDGNGLTFAGGVNTNRVVYKNSCTETGKYIGNTPAISKTPNVNNDGTATSGYAYNMTQNDPVTIAGASELKVELQYGIEEGYDYLYVFQGAYDGEITGGPMEAGQVATYTGGNNGFSAGLSDTFYVTGDTVTFAFFGDDYQDDGYYGYYAKVYPVYTTEQPDTTADTICGITADSGIYAETTTWKGKWYITNNDTTTFLENEAAVISYLEQNSNTLLGTNINIYAYNPYRIVYHGNNATAGTMTGFTTNMDTTSSTADLMAPNFKRNGYGFAGWSENQNATVNGPDKIYGPNEKVVGTDLNFNSSTHEATLYAVWVPTSGNMQDFSCDALSNNQITALTDTRDNNVYTIGKMQDGNCWMMENLRLDNTATINSSNTNNPASTFTVLSATNDDWCTSSTDACYNQSMLNTNNISIGGNNASGAALIVGPGRYNGNDWSDNAEVLGEEGNNYQWYGYGNYYNWYSATAGNGTRSVSSGDAAGDICPAGWQLPSGKTDGQFSNLDIAMGGTGSYQSDNEGEEIVSNRWRNFPNNFVYSGYWYVSSADVRGSSGYYWSRTAYDNYGACGLGFGSSDVSPGTDVYVKYDGLSARCMAQ